MRIPDRTEFKEEAKRLKEEHGIGSAKANEVLARSYGFKTHNAYLAYKYKEKINEIFNDSK